MTQFVHTDITDGIATLTIDRGETLNALSPDVLAELDSAIERLEVRALAEPATLRGMILTGAGGRAFVAGADIRAMATMDPKEGRRIGQLGQSVTLRLEALPLPVIAAVDGVALGGGCELAMACDLIFATKQSRFGQPEVKLGLVTGFGGSVRLPRFVGLARARELLYSGRIIDAPTAQRYGLVAESFDSRDALIAGAIETLNGMAANGPTAVAATKRMLREQIAMDTAAALEHELEAFAERFGSAEMREGTSAFVEKRPAQF